MPRDLRKMQVSGEPRTVTLQWVRMRWPLKELNAAVDEEGNAFGRIVTQTIEASIREQRGSTQIARIHVWPVGHPRDQPVGRGRLWTGSPSSPVGQPAPCAYLLPEAFDCFLCGRELPLVALWSSHPWTLLSLSSREPETWPDFPLMLVGLCHGRCANG
jgi:hypothetical protein